ncbi:hypothetical protein CPB85DRAFT_1445549 [Mucidula mucida]|nr:hypothetical protein CPB85DRAFT_1445549 [Mucidula mucida]
MSHPCTEEGYAVLPRVREGSTPSQELRFLRILILAWYRSRISLKGPHRAITGVSAVIHVASPLAGQGDAAKMIKAARGGVLNILQSALKAASKMFIEDVCNRRIYKNVTITSKGSLEMRLFPRNKQLKHNAAFRDLDEEDILAEKAAWDFVQAHPSIDLATIHPFTILGPVNDQFPDPDAARLGANVMVHLLLKGPGALPEWPPSHSCRTFATSATSPRRTCVRCRLIPAQGTSRTRDTSCAGGTFSWKQAVRYLEQTMSQLKQRLPDVTNTPDLREEVASIDVSLARDSLQLGGFVGWEQTL